LKLTIGFLFLRTDESQLNPLLSNHLGEASKDSIFRKRNRHNKKASTVFKQCWLLGWVYLMDVTKDSNFGGRYVLRHKGDKTKAPNKAASEAYFIATLQKHS
jgi:hypothetical protein